MACPASDGNYRMNGTVTSTWEEANQACLMAALAEVRSALERFFGHSGDSVAAGEEQPHDVVRADMPAPPAIDVISETFGLSAFERKILLMCAGIELDSRFRGLFAAQDQRHALPTLSVALAAFEGAHWSALLPSHPLRHWHLIELMAGDALTTSPLRIDECILHYLAGIPSSDERLRGIAEPLRVVGALPASQQAVADEVARTWARAEGRAAWPGVQLCGGETGSRRAVAAAACRALGLNLRLMSSAAVPHTPPELELFVHLWEREAALTPSGLLLECDDLDPVDAAGESSVKRLIDTLRSPLLISLRERRRTGERSLLWFDVPRAAAPEQLEMWKEALGSAATTLNGTVEKLVSQFNLSPGDIQAAATQALDRSQGVGRGDAPVPGGRSGDSGAITHAHAAAQRNELSSVLWDACRAQARPRLEGLAQRLEPAAQWDELVLPPRQKELLGQITLHVRQRARVYDTWGFGSKGARGLGISALFAGPSGTGKTMAGEVLANELRLDLYRIDLSQVVSKYIGETEKNLRRVFDAADDGAAILLFDEADALFGKRSEVKDSHDRYANIEVSYLLQRMEAYRGLAILTTNRREALDPAFLRRIRFVVEFPFPDGVQRAEIWRGIFPAETPTDGLRIDRLARVNAAGGTIRNIALGAAFLAADRNEPVRMTHLLQAARNEFAKLERPLTDSEVAGWV